MMRGTITANDTAAAPDAPPRLFSAQHPLSRDSDVVLVSSDGVDLHVHKLMLRLFSRVLADLLELNEDRLVLTDNAEDLKLLLIFFYPYPGRHSFIMNGTVDKLRAVAGGKVPVPGLA